MIPLYPSHSATTAAAFHRPKWRSLGHLRHAVSRDLLTAPIDESPLARRSQSVTVLLTEGVADSGVPRKQSAPLSRLKHSTPPCERRCRRPSNSSLGELRRLFPGLLIKRSTSSSADLATEDPFPSAPIEKADNNPVEQKAQQPTVAQPPHQPARADAASGAAKSRIQRARALQPLTRPSTAVHYIVPRFQKQVRHGKGSPPSVVAAAPPTLVVDGSSSLLLSAAPTGDAPSLTQQTIISTPPLQTSIQQTLVADPNQSNVPKGSDSSVLSLDVPTLVVGCLPARTAFRSASASKVEQEEVGDGSAAKARLPSSASLTTASAVQRRLLQFGKTSSVDSVRSPPSTPRVHWSPQTSEAPRFYLIQPHQLYNSDTARTKKRRRYIKSKSPFSSSIFLNYSQKFADSSESVLIRRHSVPDMTVAAYGMVICGTDELHHRYRGRIEKVKFGVPIAEAFSHDIPATLLVLLLKVNKEGPLKKDIWRAPGNQAQVRKLSHIMQHGRLVNISHISVYTAASVIKKFLSKLPGGIFGAENEQQLFNVMQNPDSEQQRRVFCRVIGGLSVPSQHLLVLLFGTFRIISDSAETFNTRMGPDAIGISVAPSLFHTCIHDGQRAKLEDVMRFKLASQVISSIIQGFGYTNLFPRECYEFYARITGRTLRVDEHWHFTFQYPSNAFSAKRDSAAFSSMMSSLTAACAAVAARSYSLETLGAHPTQSQTPPLLRSSAATAIQRGGSLKSPTTRQPLSPCNHPSTSATVGHSAGAAIMGSGRCVRSGSNVENYRRAAAGNENSRPSTSQSTSALQSRCRRADLVYATRVLVADGPPRDPPPPPPPSTTHLPPLPVAPTLIGANPRIQQRITDPEMHASRTFSQPSICYGNPQSPPDGDDDRPGPSGLSATSAPAGDRRRSDEGEEGDVYSEALPGPSVLHGFPTRGRASSSGTAVHPPLWQRKPFGGELTEHQRLSASMGEVLIHSDFESGSDRPGTSGEPSPRPPAMSSRCAESLESTRSLTYLEWVHEKQTRRMRTRSEWFLSPTMPSKNNGASKSVDPFPPFQRLTPSPLHLKLPQTDDEMALQSSSEEMRTISSQSSSAKEQRPDSPLLLEDTHPLESLKKELPAPQTGETTPRLPFQLLQHHSGESDDAPLSATPPARPQGPVFFPADDEPPTKAPKSDSSSSGGSHSQASVHTVTGLPTKTATTAPTLTRVSSIGVVRRKSWRTHYVRPNKSLDQESTPKVEVGATSHSTPIRGSSASSTRRSSATTEKTAETASRVLIRRKSSGSNSKSKAPVQPRRSTQI